MRCRALALAVLFAGGVALVEMIYHFESESDASKAFRLFGWLVDADAGRAVDLAALVFVVGLAAVLAGAAAGARVPGRT